MRRSQHRFLYPPLLLCLYAVVSLPLFLGRPTYLHRSFLQRIQLQNALPIGALGFVMSWLLKQLVSKVPLPQDPEYARQAEIIERVVLFLSGTCEELWRMCVVRLMMHFSDNAGWECMYMLGVSWCAVEGMVAYYKLRPIALPWLHPGNTRTETSYASGSPTLIPRPHTSSTQASSAASSPPRRPRLAKYIRAKEVSRTSSFFGSFYRTSPPAPQRSSPSQVRASLPQHHHHHHHHYNTHIDSDDDDSGAESDDSSGTQPALLSSSLPYDEDPLPPSTFMHSRLQSAPQIPRIITTHTPPISYGTHDGVRSHFPLHPPAPPPAPQPPRSSPSPPSSNSFLPHDSDSDSLVSVHESDFPPPPVLDCTTPLLSAPASSLPTTKPTSSTRPTYPSFPSYTTSYTPQYFPAPPSPPPGEHPGGAQRLPGSHRDPRRVFAIPINDLTVQLALLWRAGSLLRHVAHVLVYAGVLGFGPHVPADGAGDEVGAHWPTWATAWWAVVLAVGLLAAGRGANTIWWYTGQAARRGIMWWSVMLVVLAGGVLMIGLGMWGAIGPRR